MTLASSMLLPLAALSSGLADVVTLTPDAATKGDSAGKIRGTVISESATKVEVKLGSVTAIPTNEVASIEYDNAPSSLESARSKEASNALAEAAELYKKAAAEASTKPFIAEDAAFGQVHAIVELSLVEPARAAEATSLLENFSRTYKNGRHIGPALETLAKLQLAKENYTGLEQTLAQLAKLPGGDDRASLYRIKILTRKGSLDQAVSELDKAIAAAPEGSSKKRNAQIAKAEVPRGFRHPGRRPQRARRLPQGRRPTQGSPLRLSPHRHALQQGKGRARQGPRPDRPALARPPAQPARPRRGSDRAAQAGISPEPLSECLAEVRGRVGRNY
jgi:tetratricopeptide (TPR) repeat protein